MKIVDSKGNQIELKSVIQVRPDDTLVYQLKETVSKDTMILLKELFRKAFPKHDRIIIPPHGELSVMRDEKEKING